MLDLFSTCRICLPCPLSFRTRSLSQRLCSSPGRCSSESPTSSPIPISSLGECESWLSLPRGLDLSFTHHRAQRNRFRAGQMEDPTERFLAVLRYYLSGWHIVRHLFEESNERHTVRLSCLAEISLFSLHTETPRVSLFSCRSWVSHQARGLIVIVSFLDVCSVADPHSVKKPYNAVLGEIFRCTYKYPDGSEGFYVAEQGASFGSSAVRQERMTRSTHL